MKELIVINTGDVGGQSVQTVNARDLHSFLGVAKDFSDWIKAQIKRARLVEGQDYVVFPLKGEKGRPTLEYSLTIDAAKHISMMSGTDKGFEARQYFIECERIVQKATSAVAALPTPEVSTLNMWIAAGAILNTPKHLTQVEAVKAVKKVHNVDFTPLLLVSPEQDDISDNNKWLEPTELGKLFGMSAREMNAFLCGCGVQVNLKDTGHQAIGEGKANSSSHQWFRGNKSGYNIKWRVSFVRALVDSAEMAA